MKNRDYSWIYAVTSIVFYLEYKSLNIFPIGVFIFLAPLIRLLDLEITFKLNRNTLSLLSVVSAMVFSNILLFEVKIIDSAIYGGALVVLFIMYMGVKTVMKPAVAYMGLVLMFTAVDFFVANTILSDSLILGDVFFIRNDWTQWYSSTGIIAGTTWIVIVNIFCYFCFFHKDSLMTGNFRWRTFIIVLLLIVVPVLTSGSLTSSFEFGPTMEQVESNKLSERWEGVLVAENPKNEYKSMYSQYDEYLGRTSVWISLLLILSMGVKFKTRRT